LEGKREIESHRCSYIWVLGAISQMKNLLLIGLILLTFSCGEKQRQLTEPTDSLTQADAIKFDKADNIISTENCHTWLTDSILSTGDFVNYIKDNGKVKIEWGNKNFKRTFNQDYSCTGAPSWIPKQAQASRLCRK